MFPTRTSVCQFRHNTIPPDNPRKKCRLYTVPQNRQFFHIFRRWLCNLCRKWLLCMFPWLCKKIACTFRFQQEFQYRNGNRRTIAQSCPPTFPNRNTDSNTVRLHSCNSQPRKAYKKRSFCLPHMFPQGKVCKSFPCLLTNNTRLRRHSAMNCSSTIRRYRCCPFSNIPTNMFCTKSCRANRHICPTDTADSPRPPFRPTNNIRLRKGICFRSMPTPSPCIARTSLRLRRAAPFPAETPSTEISFS